MSNLLRDQPEVIKLNRSVDLLQEQVVLLQNRADALEKNQKSLKGMVFLAMKKKKEQ